MVEGMKKVEGQTSCNALPLISVVMPCYNAERFVAEAVDSVLKQSYPHVELIVVDDGSTDRSLDILRSYGDRIKLLSQSNQGPYPARNHGLAYATGEYVAFLDADDCWSLDCLEKLHTALAAHPECALAYCGWQNVGNPRQGGKPFIPRDYENEGKLESFLRGASLWPIHAALVRREALDRIGGFDTSLPTCMDYDLWLRLSTNQSIIRVPEVLAFYRHHEHGQITSKQWHQAINSWRIKKKFIATHPERVSNLTPARLRELIDGALLRRGYSVYWSRDLVSARHIFRLALRTGSWKLNDLRYLLPALLPEQVYLRLVNTIDRKPVEKEPQL